MNHMLCHSTLDTQGVLWYVTVGVSKVLEVMQAKLETTHVYILIPSVFCLTEEITVAMNNHAWWGPKSRHVTRFGEIRRSLKN